MICLSSNALKFALRAELDAWKFQFTSQLVEVSLAEVPPPPRTNWTRRVPHPVLIGHAASLTP